ncbi:MAG TPA: hypothetical protein VGN42_25825, partial [Pirellulales bacterium]|nr:hypothetical protein [Pirellulales bacterium]
ANEAWCIGLATALFVSLCFGSMVAVFGRGVSRSFWSGFIILGWSYILFERPRAFLATDWIVHQWMGSPENAIANTDKWTQTYYIGLSLWGLLIGIVGGLVGRHLHLRREREKAASPASTN